MTKHPPVFHCYFGYIGSIHSSVYLGYDSNHTYRIHQKGKIRNNFFLGIFSSSNKNLIKKITEVLFLYNYTKSVNCRITWFIGLI